MAWIVISICSAAAFAIITIIDKVILMRHAPSPAAFIVMIGVLQTLSGLLVIILVPFGSYTIGDIGLAFASGLVWGVALVLLLWVLSREDVSIVTPIVSTSPVFVAVMAVIFLSEHLSVWHWIAIMVTVGGAALISIQPAEGSRGGFLGMTFALLLLSSLMAAGAQFLTKVSLQDMTLWNQFAIRNFGLGAACILLPLRPSIIREIRQLISSRAGFWLLVLNEGPLAFGAIFLNLWAIALGPVSLVATLMSTRPLFAFLLSVLLSTSLWPLLNEPLDRTTLVKKSISTAMIVGGVIAIALL